MTEHNEHINQYSAADIERYYSGKMSAQEMHQLEKAALDDPFLADALEGYQYAARPEEESKELQKALLSKLEKGKVITLQKRENKNQLLKIAAMFVLIAGTAWLVYQFGFGNREKDIAVITESTKQEETKADTAIQDLSATSGSHLSTTASPETTETAGLAGNKKNKEPNLSQQNKDFKSNLSDEQEAVASSTTNNRIGSIATESIEQKNNAADVVAATRQAAPQAEMRTKESDSTVVVGYDTQKKADANQNNAIVLQRAKDSNMQEIVLGKGRNDSSVRRRSNIAFEDVEPEKGQRFYDDYVAQNLNIPEEIKIKNTSGEVQLSFDVNELGEPVNIKVEKSLCEDCDKEAVRILKEGPKWAKKKKKGKVRIRF